MSNKILTPGLVAHACSPVTWNSETENYKFEANLSSTALKPPPSKHLNNFLKFLIMKVFII